MLRKPLHLLRHLIQSLPTPPDILIRLKITDLPKDPKVGNFTGCNTYNTGYTLTIFKVEGSTVPKITVTAPNAEATPEGISASR